MQRDLSVIESESYRQVQEIRGKADAEATRIYAEAYDQSARSRELYAFLKTMETYRKVVDADSTLLLSTNGELFRFLRDAEGGARR